ncbi:hypothetical protein OAS39_02485 [Pirellulales bacterium]|nr:hypothetical protein [Pirellulales bacterium]
MPPAPSGGGARGRMNSSSSLTFLWTPWSLAISLLVVVATAGLCWFAWRRSGYNRAVGGLELLRLLIVGVIAVLLNQPEWIEQYRPEVKPTVVLLQDASPSMDTRDVIGESTSATRTRRETAEAIVAAKEWEPLRERMNIVVETFSQAEHEDAGGETDLYAPLAEAPKKYQDLLATVMISDGDWTAGQPPVDAAARLRLAGTPVYTVTVGSPTRLPDVELLSLDAPTFGVAGKAVRVPVTIESALPRDYVTTMRLKTSDGTEIEKEVRIAAMGRTSDSFLWKPAAVGDYELTVTIPKHGDELLPDNNELSAPIAIREEKLHVLVVESYPRWEYRYLRNALSRDPGVEVSCLLFHPELSRPGGGSRDYIKQFPAGLDELAEYDVIFLGDVGLDDGQLTDEDCRLIKGLIEHQASGLVFMPGWQGRQFTLLETELAGLYPVVLDDAQVGGWGSRTPNHFELTEAGRNSLLTKLADTPDENIAVWESLPGFQWYAPVLRARAGSEVLCVHHSQSNRFGRLPLLATRTHGAGKVLFMGTDGAWRWRKGVEDKYHYRFWGQVVRWMAYQRNMAKGETMRLYYTPDQPQAGQTLVVSANVMETSGEPLQKGVVTARIVAPSGAAKTIRFRSTGDGWGAFAAEFTPQEPGNHAVALACKQTGATLEASIYVQGVAGETAGRPARPEVLEEIARVSRGKAVSPGKLGEIAQLLSSLPDPPPAIRRLQLWSHPAAVALVVVLLGVFWSGRKVVGMI